MCEQVGILVRRGIVPLVVLLVQSETCNFVQEALVPGVALRIKVCIKLLLGVVQNVVLNDFSFAV